MKKMEKVKFVADWVRNWAEKTRNDPELEFPENLTGMCSICSYVIAHGLMRFKIPYKFVYNYCRCGCHVYLEVNDHIIDVTATQFGVNEKVIVKKIKQNPDMPYWFNDRSRFTITEYEDKMAEWSYQQQPYGNEGFLKKAVDKGIDKLWKTIDKMN